MSARPGQTPGSSTTILSSQEKIARGKELKEMGNQAYRTAGTDKIQLTNAMRRYHEAVNYFTGLDNSQVPGMMPATLKQAPTLSEAEKSDVEQNLVACYNNMAACQVRLERWDRVVANADQALKRSPNNAKALFRRGQAYLKLGELLKAEKDLKQASNLAPGDAGVAAELATLARINAEYDKKQRKEWAGLFDRMAISVGGVKSRVDKDALLRKAAQDRARRARDALRASSAAHIQAFVRGRAVAAAVRIQLRARFELLMPTLNDSPESVIEITRVLIFSCPPYSLAAIHADTKLQVSRLSQWLVQEPRRWLAPFQSSNIRESWMVLFPRLLILCLRASAFTDTSSAMNLVIQALSNIRKEKLENMMIPKIMIDKGALGYLFDLVQHAVNPPDNFGKIHILANLASVFANNKFSDVDTAMKTNLANAFGNLINHLESSSFSGVLQDESLDDSDSDAEDENSASMEGVQFDSKTVEILEEDVKMQLASLTHSSFISSVISVTTHSENDSLIVATLSLLLTIIYRWHSKKSSILNVAAFDTKSGILRRCLSITKASTIWRESLNKSDWGSLLNDASLADDWLFFTFLCETLSHKLQIMSDSEMAEMADPVSLADIVVISAVLRNVLFHVYWNGADLFKFSQLMEHNQHILNTFAALSEQIYSRDSRTRFCPQNHWEMTSELDIHSFVRAAIADSDPIVTSKSPIRSVISTSPRQQVLKHIPYVIPFEVRVKIFREWIRRDRELNGLDAGHWLRPIANIEVQRGQVFEDAFLALDKLGPGLKNRIAVTFKSLDGLVEAGIDGGGVFKEFLTELLKDVFVKKVFNLFQSTSENLIYPQTNYVFDATRLKYMEFFGRMIGKALYEGILIDTEFAGFFLAKWLGRQSYLDDLRSLDHEVYKNLLMIKSSNLNVNDLGLDFTVTEELTVVDKNSGMPTTYTGTVELIPGGSAIPVTNENKIRYIYVMANYKLNSRISKPCTELQFLVGGATVPIDLEDLRGNIKYNGDFHEQHFTIRLFWETVYEFDEKERRLLVKFVTSCERPPLLGFAELNPLFCIHPSGTDEDRLPTASTCINMLKLPEYTTKTALKQKLLYAINAGAGFEMS
ncbi:hypothetical protein HDU83_002749 [Entophlyctis luteolus]|nr:hypothetical protein HDU83_002749 [Entophlyctis luteolus]